MLVTALEQAGAARGRLALLWGESGIGKTRLLEELADRAGAQGTVVAWGRAYEGDGAPAFWPWVQVIDALIAGLDPERAADALGEGATSLAQIAPNVRSVARQAAPLPPGDPAAARFRLCQEMTSFLTRLAATQPVVVVLDDLHWADIASLELVRFLATRLERTRLLIAAAYRPADVVADDPLASALGELARVPGLIRLSLEGLNPSEVRRLTAQTTGIYPSPAVTAAIYEQTQGNPFFVVELARLLASEGAVTKESRDASRVPAGVRDVIRRRLAALPRATNHLLSAAAVMGRDFELAVVARAAQIDEEGALGAVDAAVAAGIVVEEASSLDGYRFSHALVRQAIYAELPRRSRAQLHARVGEALERQSCDDNSRAAELAQHWFEAAPIVGPERGIAAALGAATTAQARLAFEQAEDQLRRALALVERLPPGPDRARQQLSVQNRLASVLTVTQGFASDVVAEAWARARALAGLVGTTPDLVPSLWGSFTMPLVRLELEAATEVAGQLRELARTRDDPAFRLAGLLGSALARFHGGCLVAARQDLEEAKAACDALDDPGALADTFAISPAVLSRGYLSLAYWLLEDDGRARKTSEESLAIAGARHRHQYSLTSALVFDTWVRILGGDAAAVRRRLAQIKANKVGVQESVPLMTVLSAWARAGDDHAELEEAGQALRALIGSGFNLMSTLYMGFLVDAHLRAGSPEAALAAADEALAQVEATGERFFEAELCRLRAEALAAQSPPRGDEAEHWLHRAMAVAECQQAAGSRQRAGATLARLTREHEQIHPRPFPV